MTMGPGAVVGSILFHLNGGTGVEEGWHTSTTSSELFPVEGPPGGIQLPTKIGGAYVLTNAHYLTDNLQGTVVVTGNDVILTVNNTFKVNDFRVQAGANIKLYVNAADVALTKLDNRNIRAESFMYYGLEGNQNIALGGNGSFCGVVCVGIEGGGQSTPSPADATIDTLLPDGYFVTSRPYSEYPVNTSIVSLKVDRNVRGRAGSTGVS